MQILVLAFRNGIFEAAKIILLVNLATWLAGVGQPFPWKAYVICMTLALLTIVAPLVCLQVAFLLENLGLKAEPPA